MTTDTTPSLTDTINTLGEIRDHLRHHPRFVEALLRAQEGLSEAGTTITLVNLTATIPAAEYVPALGDIMRECDDWLAKHGAKP